MCYNQNMKYKVIRKQNISPACFVCGTKNSFSLKANFYECEREDGEMVLLTVFSGHNNHQSYPGRMHGGITSTILDEAIGRAMAINHRQNQIAKGEPETDIWGVTIDLQVKFRKAVPLETELYCETKIIKETHRSFEGEGKLMLADGTVCATAFGKYLILTPEQICEGNTDVLKENWMYEDTDFPKEFSIGI